MSRSTRSKQTSGRRQNTEEEPFLVKEISGSPVIRGRRQNNEEEPFLVEEIPRSPIFRGKRQNSEEERFVVENISRSPVFRGRRQNSEEERCVVENISRSPVLRGRRQNSGEERFVVESIPRSPIMRGKRLNAEEERSGVHDISEDPSARERESRVATPSTTRTLDMVDTTKRVTGWNSTTERTNENPPRGTTTTPSVSIINNRYHGPPDNEDAPPSYESSIPPSQIGWSPNVLASIPFPMPYSSVHNDERIASVHNDERIAYTSSPPNVGFSAMAPYLPMESTNSRSPLPSISQSPSPRLDRFRPAYTYQPRITPVGRSPTRQQFRRYSENVEDSTVKPNSEFSYRYGGIIVALFFVVFLMLLSLAVKFVVRNHSH